MRPPLQYCGLGQRPLFSVQEVSQNTARRQQQQWTPASNSTAPNPYYAGYYGFPPDLSPQIAQLQQSIQTLEERINAQTTKQSSTGKKSAKNKTESRIPCVSDTDTLYSDVSSGDEMSDSDVEKQSDNDMRQSFKDLKASSFNKNENSEQISCSSNLDKLQKLSKDFEAKDEFSDDVHSDLATTINSGMKSNHSQSACKELMDKYLVPRNCEFIRVPLINPELWNSDNLMEPYKGNDKMLFKNQRITTKAMLPVVQIMNKCLQDNTKTDIFDLACDAFQILVYGHRDMSQTRRQFLEPAVSKQYRKLCQSSVPVTEHLFGDDLHKQMRDLNEAQKLIQDLAGRKSRPKPSNYSGPQMKRPRFEKEPRRDFRQKAFLDRKARPSYKRTKNQGSGRKPHSQ